MFYLIATCTCFPSSARPDRPQSRKKGEEDPGRVLPLNGRSGACMGGAVGGGIRRATGDALTGTARGSYTRRAARAAR